MSGFTNTPVQFEDEGKRSKTLILCATLFELTAFWEYALTDTERQRLASVFQRRNYRGLFNIRANLDCCITGVGVPATLLHLARLHIRDYDFVLSVGFGGSYSPRLQIGEVVQITEDAFADLGVMDKGQFVPLNATPFFGDTGKQQPFYTASNLFVPNYRQCRALTRNMPTGELSNLAGLDWKKEQVDIESMEGAAVALECELYAKEFLTLRVVSNYVRPAQEAQWNSELAKANLAVAILDVLKTR